MTTSILTYYLITTLIPGIGMAALVVSLISGIFSFLGLCCCVELLVKEENPSCNLTLFTAVTGILFTISALTALIIPGQNQLEKLYELSTQNGCVKEGEGERR